MIVNDMQGLDSMSKIMKKIIPNFRKKQHIFSNLPGFGLLPKTMRKNTEFLELEKSFVCYLFINIGD